MIEYKLNTLYNLIKINWEIKDDISEAFYKENLFIVKYNSWPKKYFYARNSIEIIKKPEIFDEKSNFFNKNFFYNEWKLITWYKKIFYFSWWFYRFVFEKWNFITYNWLKIVDNLLKDKTTVNTIKYFKNIIPLVNSKEMSNFLLNQYEKIDFINPESFLYSYLSKNNKNYTDKNTLNIFPFDFNLSQKEAIENIYKSNISIIKWPPWTWKTQTILNIISNLIIQNKKIAIVSWNNSATSNIKEKFEKYWYNFLIASLWNNENKDLFFNNIHKIKTFESNKSKENNLDFTEKLKEISYLMEISNNKSILKKQTWIL